MKLLFCTNCQREYQTKNEKSKFCCIRCQKEKQNEEKIREWLDNKTVGYCGKALQIKAFVRRYLLKKNQYKCSKCGWDKINPITGNTPLEINHIDGNAKNSFEKNLEVLCPNCHALTHNFRALNRNSLRVRN